MRNFLRMHRKAGELTQAELGDKVGLSGAAICLLESGQRNPTLTTAYKLADLFDCPVTHLWPHEPEKKDE